MEIMHLLFKNLFTFVITYQIIIAKLNNPITNTYILLFKIQITLLHLFTNFSISYGVKLRGIYLSALNIKSKNI